MSWEDISERVAPASKHHASIRLVCRAKAKLPACIISFRGQLGKTLNWKSGDAVGVQVGKGENAGKLRIVKGAPKGIAAVRKLNKGGYSFDLGHIAALGTDEHGLVGCEATKIDASTVEVVIPNWDEVEQEEEEEPQEVKPASPQPAPVRPTAPGIQRPAQSLTPKQVRFGDIIFDLAEGREEIRHNGRSHRLTFRQAEFLSALARTMPDVVGRDFLCRKLFGGTGKEIQNDAKLDLVATDAKAIVAAVGLKLTKVAIGFGLTKA